jgi:hypothetical protein
MRMLGMEPERLEEKNGISSLRKCSDTAKRWLNEKL